MKRVGVDTNVVVSLVTDRDAEQQTRAAELFASAAAGEHVVVLPQAVILEAVYVLCNLYGAESRVVSGLMRDLLSLPGVVTIDSIGWRHVWTLWPRRIEDFGDACIAAVAAEGGFDSLATFDAGLARRARRQGVPTHW